MNVILKGHRLNFTLWNIKEPIHGLTLWLAINITLVFSTSHVTSLNSSTLSLPLTTIKVMNSIKGDISITLKQIFY